MKRVSLSHFDVLEFLEEVKEYLTERVNEETTITHWHHAVGQSGFSVDEDRRVIYVTDDSQTKFCKTGEEWKETHEYVTADGWKVIIRVFGCGNLVTAGYDDVKGFLDRHVIGGTN